VTAPPVVIDRHAVQPKPPTSLTQWNPTTRWDPFRELEEMHHRLTSIFDRTPMRRDGKQEFISAAEWAPLVDISENDKTYTVKVELPEMKREDIKVSVENGVLAIFGERKFEQEEKGKKYHRVERSYGSFVRSFTLPDNADAGQVNAQYRDGVLTVDVQKSAQAKPRAIDVKVT
jgi:HSP20 family protein